MPKVNPKDKQSTTTVPPGEYTLALVWFRRKQGKTSGRDYLSCKWEVILGPQKGNAFFANLATDVSKRGTVIRWQLLAESCGVEDEFELGDSREGTDKEGDASISALFLGKAIVARVKREDNGGYVNNDLERFVSPNDWSPEQKAAIQKWTERWEARMRARGNPEDQAPDEYDSYDEAPPHAASFNPEDDIPF